jgi:hypothetical protein
VESLDSAFEAVCSDARVASMVVSIDNGSPIRVVQFVELVEILRNEDIK